MQMQMLALTFDIMYSEHLCVQCLQDTLLKENSFKCLLKVYANSLMQITGKSEGRLFQVAGSTTEKGLTLYLKNACKFHLNTNISAASKNEMGQQQGSHK